VLLYERSCCEYVVYGVLDTALCLVFHSDPSLALCLEGQA
jgi:hypothetical protein